jgi:hypothetical protein
LSGTLAWILQGVLASAEMVKTIVEGVVEIVFNLFTGKLTASKDAVVKLWDDIVEVTTEQGAKIQKISDDTDKKFIDALTSRRKATESHLESVHGITAAATQKETQTVLDELDRRLTSLRANEQLELSDKMLVNQQKEIILRDYASKEIAIIEETKNQIGDDEVRSAERIAAIRTALQLKLNQLHQSGLTNWKQANSDWAAHAVDTDARVAEIGRQTFDQLANNFGQATAKMIMSGKSFSQTFEALFRNMAEQVISQLTAMIAKALILKALSGTAFGGFLGIPIFAAEGARVYGPTHAVIGEGGEPESVVPDSKAKDFARGVLAGGGGNLSPSSLSGAPGGGGGQSVVVNMSVTVNLSSSAGNADILFREFTQKLSAEGADAIRFALATQNVATRNAGRAV